jgi:hypothetical protein
MGQQCATAKSVEDAKSKKGAASVAAVPNATKFSYQLPNARREKMESPFPQSKNPDDYMSSGLKDGTWIRLPGQINDQRINIENAVNSTFLLLDHCDSVQVDECTDCVFFIGPTTGSVFIRGCINCKIVVLCGQLRLRDVKNSDIALFCRSRPVIESSRNVGIGCFAGPQYLDLRWQLARAQLSIWNNLWHNVHDFTPNPDSWHALSKEEARGLIPSLADLTPTGYISVGEECMTKIVPWIKCLEAKAFIIVVGKAGHHDDMDTLLLEFNERDTPCILETGEAKLQADGAKLLTRVLPNAVKTPVREGDVHAVVCLAARTDIDVDAIAAREGVLLVVTNEDGTAAKLREALIGRAGSDSGFGSAF